MIADYLLDLRLKTYPADDMISAMNIWLVFEKVSVIFALVLVGFAYSKISKQKDPSSISKLVLNVSVPASILSTITTADYEAIKADLPILIIIAVSVTLATLILSFVMTFVLNVKIPAQKAAYRSALFFNNYGFMGWPICQMLLGSQGFLYAALYSIPLHLLSYGITPALMRAAGDHKKLFDKSVLINLPLYATVLGLIVLMCGLRLPETMTGFLDMVGVTQTPLSMIVIGMILAGADLKAVVKGFKPYMFSVFRLLLLPTSAFLILHAIGFSGLMLSVPVIITAMPAGAMVVVLAQKHKADPLLTSRLTVISTLLSVVTIPLISMLIL